MASPLIALLVVSAVLASHASLAAARTTADRPDEIVGKQIHGVYALPSDGVDRQLDTNGTIANEIASFQRWLAAQTAGLALRVDRATGGLDVTFFRLSKTDAEVAARGAFVRDEIEAELHAADFDAPNKIYAVWYDGSSTYACGGGAYPPSLRGDVAAMYLHGVPRGAPPCAGSPLATPGNPPGYLQFAMLHEILHTIGFVPSCAPHEVLAGHVSDSPSDLMYAGVLPWYPSVLDFGRDDYFRAQIPNCLDLVTSGWLGPSGDTTDPVLQLGVRRTKSVFKLGAFWVVVRCPTEPCTATARGTVAVPRAAMVYRLRSATKQISKGRKASLKLKFSKRALRAMRRAISQRKTIKIRVSVTARDAAGNSTLKRRAIRLKR